MLNTRFTSRIYFRSLLRRRVRDDDTKLLPVSHPALFARHPPRHILPNLLLPAQHLCGAELVVLFGTFIRLESAGSGVQGRSGVLERKYVRPPQERTGNPGEEVGVTA